MTVAAGRLDLDAALRAPMLAPGEPVFLLRGQDHLGADAVRAWATLAFAAGVPPAVVEQALRQADRLAAWAPRKLPDADHLTTDERLQLAYQFRRRAWNARHDVPPTDIALAEQRGWDAAMARMRGPVTQRQGAE